MTKLIASLLMVTALTSVASAGNKGKDWCKPRGEASVLAAKMWHLMGRIEVGECQHVDEYIDAMKAEHKAADRAIATCKGVYLKKDADTMDYEARRKELKEACAEVDK
jgi:hypothetical protein